MMEDPVPGPQHQMAPLPVNRSNSAPSQSSVPPSEAPSSSSPAPSYTTRGDLISRIADPQPGLPPFQFPHHPPSSEITDEFAPSPFLPSINIYSLLPVLYQDRHRQLLTAENSAVVDANNQALFDAHRNLVFAIGRVEEDGTPAWTTSLVCREFFLSQETQKAIKLHLPIPIRNIILGGRNRSLITRHRDPCTEAESLALIDNPKKGPQAVGYINRIRFTPPELRAPFHSRILQR